MKLSEKMYSLNASLSALIYIQKVETREEAITYLKRVNVEVAKWIKEARVMEDDQ